KVAKTAAMDRRTDTSRYTGSHKERFDESGKGKGREGREEIVENTGTLEPQPGEGHHVRRSTAQQTYRPGLQSRSHSAIMLRQKTSRVITYEEFQRALEELAPKRFKGHSKEEALQSIFKLVEGREPTNVGVTKVAKTAAMDRLTDTSRYTGSHKERFDESGKGKGREGREEIVENTGYVGAYKNAGTYDTKMKAPK
ncbi:tubulin polymerization-promoting protein family member 3-like, partial [Mastacembelus armatus]|uniref:tubulin polymerization-promoting protein family member 3-like n=1 Tax=Mastacembelus armatus TaxID=205130 RepID=UPI000E4589A8